MVVVRAEVTRRNYALDPEALAELDTWLAQFRDRWRQRAPRFAHDGSARPLAVEPRTFSPRASVAAAEP